MMPAGTISKHTLMLATKVSSLVQGLLKSLRTSLSHLENALFFMIQPPETAPEVSALESGLFQPTECSL